MRSKQLEDAIKFIQNHLVICIVEEWVFCVISGPMAIGACLNLTFMCSYCSDWLVIRVHYGEVVAECVT